MEIFNKDTSNPGHIQVLDHAKRPLSSHAVLGDVGELLPCPFCGSKAKTPRTAIGIEGEYVSCSNKDCPCESYLFLIHQWNKRANFA